ncbi:MAG TPA: hypothetical protein VFB59_04675 [Candidatus Saccharimonadales bacterium]|nr:hypothetical protein [Candidatus Saccharimonadales bacterium]
MGSRKKQPERKIVDVSRPKKRPVTGTPASEIFQQLVIPKRAVIHPPAPVTAPSYTVPEPLQTSRIVKTIKPISEDLKQDKAPSPPVPPAAAAETKPAPRPTPPKKVTPPEPATKPEPKTPAPKAEPKEEQAPPEQNTGATATVDTSVDADAHKALEEAKRQEQIQGYIDKREFFVPINRLARKRSIKVMLALVFVELLLGAFLVNLMLDAGLIYLLEKIPHTNFFDLQ